MTAAAAWPKHGVITATSGIEGERQCILEILQKTKTKGTGIYEVGDKKAEKTLWLWYKLKKNNKVVEGVKEKQAAHCVKKKKKERIWPGTDFKFQVSFMQLLSKLYYWHSQVIDHSFLPFYFHQHAEAYCVYPCVGKPWRKQQGMQRHRRLIFTWENITILFSQ